MQHRTKGADVPNTPDAQDDALTREDMRSLLLQATGVDIDDDLDWAVGESEDTSRGHVTRVTHPSGAGATFIEHS